MSKKIDLKEKTKIIRKGNKLFNDGEIEKAAKLFWHVDYKDGLIRVAEYLSYDLKKPFQALLYYKKAGMVSKSKEIIGRILWALEKMIKS